jgi:hypothetical protein
VNKGKAVRGIGILADGNLRYVETYGRGGRWKLKFWAEEEARRITMRSQLSCVVVPCIITLPNSLTKKKGTK